MTSSYIPGPQYGPSSGYGPRNPPKAGASEFHHGIDFGAPLGTPILAAADGKVYYTGDASGYGRVVILKHTGADGATYFTVYGHMNELPDLTLGQPVKAGQEIGKVGNNGTSSGPHLHFETVDGDTAFNYAIHGTSTGVKGDVNRVNPNTFDFHGNTVFNGAGPLADLPSSPKTQPSTALPPNSPPGVPGPRLQLSPGMPIPGAEGPTSFGGPNGPTPLVPPPSVPNQGKRSDIPGDAPPDAPQATAQAVPASWAFPHAGLGGLDGVLKYFNSAPPGTTQNLPFGNPSAPGFSSPGIANDEIVPERRLASRVINLSAPASPGAPPLSPDLPDTVNNAGNWTAASAAPTPGTPDAQSASQSPLGIFSGKPMPDWPVLPPIFQPKDQSSPDDNELFQRWMRWLDA
jgi:hypothetical protein